MYLDSHIQQIKELCKQNEVERLQDMKKVLRNFYIQQVEKEVDKYQLGDQLLNEHLRTPYK